MVENKKAGTNTRVWLYPCDRPGYVVADPLQRDAPKCSVSAFEIIRGVVADGVCLMVIKIPHDSSPAYWTVG